MKKTLKRTLLGLIMGAQLIGLTNCTTLTTPNTEYSKESELTEISKEKEYVPLIDKNLVYKNYSNLKAKDFIQKTNPENYQYFNNFFKNSMFANPRIKIRTN